MSGNSSSDQPHAMHELKPSAEVAAKMQPVSREAFHSLLNRASNSPGRKPDPKAK